MSIKEVFDCCMPAEKRKKERMDTNGVYNYK